MKPLFFVILLMLSATLAAITFTEINTGLPGVRGGSTAWGDYDNDGNLDIVITGKYGYSLSMSKIYRNNGDNTFTDINAGLTGVGPGLASWGDYDNDRDLDILLTGYYYNNGVELIISKIYRNNGNSTFTDINAGLTGVGYGSAAWGDYDNDGDLDILLAGSTGSIYISKVYRNNGNSTFTDIAANLTGINSGSVAWGDYDNDGDLDILLTGYTGTGSTCISKIYRNDGNNTFTDITAGLVGVTGSSVAWGDYDNDGYLDILLTGYAFGPRYSKVYHNNGNNTFSDLAVALIGVGSSAVAWGDYDNDGDLDILQTGHNGTTNISIIYRNDGNNIFTDIPAGLVNVSGGSVAWGDYDNDGDLDILMTGASSNIGYLSKIYRNDGATPNTVPTAPTYLRTHNAGDFINFQWNASLDAETPSLGLTYELRIGTTPGGSQISAPMSSSNGFRRIPAIGKSSSVCQWKIKTSSLPVPFYWSVQAIDGAFAGSAFAPEQTVTSTTLTFTDIAADITGVQFGSVAWGDYDSDGDLDILQTGFTGSTAISKVYRNNGNSTFTDIAAGLTGVDASSAAWGDYDNDSDLDILLAGETLTGTYISKVYRNDGNNTFTDIAAGLTGVYYSSVAWGDYDNDGDLDILLTGVTTAGGNYTSLIYRNNGNSTFTDIAAGLPGVENGSVAWGDYDNDGDLDILLAGYTGSTYISRIYRNDGNGSFTDIVAGLSGVYNGSVAWGDYDNDGDLDIVLTGYTGSTNVSKIYRNNGNSTFTDTAAAVSNVGAGTADWGDYDNDGDLDLLLTGQTATSTYISKIYRNDGNTTFTDITAGLQGVDYSSAAWGDYDNDGDLDIFLAGHTASTLISKIYRNDSSPINQLPFPPVNLRAIRSGDFVVFQWNPAFDITTPTAGLSYTLRIGTTPSGCEINSPMAGVNDYRMIPIKGTAQSNCYWKIKASALTYPLYWSVQTINTVFAGSAFATEVILLSAPPYFTDSNTTLPGVYYGSSEWGDYDNDGLMDVYLSGSGSGNWFSKIFHNNGNNSFTDTNAGFPIIQDGFAAWGDFDNDGDLDIILTGTTTIPPNFVNISRIYRNNGDNTFTDINAGLPGVVYGSCAWGDYDNDGDLDVLLTGSTSSDYITKIFKNNGNGTFSELASSITGFMYSSCAWGDYDNDSDLDFVIRGYQGSAYYSRIYTNNGNDTFSVLYSSTLFAQITRGIITWGDYDADGDLDVLLSGGIGSSNLVTKIYRNNGAGSFTDINANITGMYEGKTVWGDYDNDGDLDVLITGSGFTKVFNNTNGVFNDIQTSFAGAEYSNASWVDTDNDGDLDLHVTGYLGGNVVSKIYLNQGSQNNSPLAPTNLYTTITGNYMLFQWSPSSDQQTPSSGLSYNLRIGTTPGGNQISAAMSGLNGIRLIPARGFIYGLCSWKIKTSVLPGHYYWSVQAIDSGFLGSPFAAEQEHICIPKAPQNFMISRVGEQINLGWDIVTQDMENNPITPTYYDIYINITGDPNGEYIYFGQASENTYTMNPDLIESNKVFFRVFAVVSSRSDNEPTHFRANNMNYGLKEKK